jgi:hypothetical protein
VLRCEGPSTSEGKQKDVEGSKDVTPDQGKHEDEGEQTKSSEVEIKTLDPPKKHSLIATLGKSENLSHQLPPCSRRREISMQDGYSMKI